MGFFDLYRMMMGWWNSGTSTNQLTGQWSNVLLLESKQPRVELYGQEWVTLGANQGRVEVELP